MNDRDSASAAAGGGSRARRRSAVTRDAVLLLAAACAFPSCSLLQPKMDAAFAQRMATAVFDSEDPDTVLSGVPAFVLLLDGVLVDQPSAPEPWLAGAQLNAALASLVAAEDRERFRILSEKALRYANEGIRRQDPELAGLRDCTFDELDRKLAAVDLDDVPALLALGSAWAAWIRSKGEDVEAIGDLSRVRAILERVLELDDAAGNGMAHLYLGAFDSMVSPDQGGDLEPARRHFERALELSGGKDLTAKTALAIHYAGRKGDHELERRLLREVVATDPRATGRTLLNVLAQRRARAVLAGERDPWSPY